MLSPFSSKSVDNLDDKGEVKNCTGYESRSPLLSYLNDPVIATD